jgi:hypothetical protein
MWPSPRDVLHTLYAVQTETDMDSYHKANLLNNLERDISPYFHILFLVEEQFKYHLKLLFHVIINSEVRR